MLKRSGKESSSPPTVVPKPARGYIYLYVEDEIPHFCWRERSTSLDDPAVMDLFMPPGDGTFIPYAASSGSGHTTNGRIYVLKFSSSSTRHVFWLQSSNNGPNPNTWTHRDLKLGEIVNQILQGEEVNVQQAMADLPSGGGPGGDDDTTMEDADGSGSDLQRAASGGAGADATGGDVRDEGEEAREGGADGARA